MKGRIIPNKPFFLLNLLVFILLLSAVGCRSTEKSPAKSSRPEVKSSDSSGLEDIWDRLKNPKRPSKYGRTTADNSNALANKGGMDPLTSSKPPPVAQQNNSFPTDQAQQNQEIIDWRRQQWEQAQQNSTTAGQLDSTAKNNTYTSRTNRNSGSYSNYGSNYGYSNNRNYGYSNNRSYGSSNNRYSNRYGSTW